MPDYITTEELQEAKTDAQTLEDVINGGATFGGSGLAVGRGGSIKTLRRSLLDLGYRPPFLYTGAVLFNKGDENRTIEYNGDIYAPLPSELPFSTTGTWEAFDELKFYLVQRKHYSTPEDFGAKGDKIEDDTAAVQAAIDHRAASGGGVVLARKSYKLTGDHSLIMKSNVFIDFGHSGELYKDILVPAANFYDKSYIYFDQVSNCGVLNGKLIGTNSVTANSDNTTGTGIMIHGRCEDITLKNLRFDEAWTAILAGTDFVSANANKNLVIHDIYGVDCEQLVVSSATKNFDFNNFYLEKQTKYTQRCLYIQNSQDGNVSNIRSKDIEATTILLKGIGHGGALFPQANININGVVSSNPASGSICVALAIHAGTETTPDQVGETVKFINAQNISCESPGAAVQIICDRDYYMYGINISNISGVVRNAICDIRVKGIVQAINISDVTIDTTNAEFGINVDGETDPFTEYARDIIHFSNFKCHGKANQHDIIIQDYTGVTVDGYSLVRDLNDPTYLFSKTKVTTTNASFCYLNVNDPDFIDVGGHLIVLNGALEGADQEFYINNSVGDDKNPGTSTLRFASFSRLMEILPKTINIRIDVYIEPGIYAEDIEITNMTFNTVANFFFSTSTFKKMILANVRGLDNRLYLFNGTLSSNTDGMDIRSCTGFEIHFFNTPLATSVGANILNSNGMIRSCDFGTSAQVCLAVESSGIIVSRLNSGNGIANGLRAKYGSVIAKSSTQPTGTASNEATSDGGAIR